MNHIPVITPGEVQRDQMIANRSGIANGLIVPCMKNMTHVKLILLAYTTNAYGITEMVTHTMHQLL